MIQNKTDVYQTYLPKIAVSVLFCQTYTLVRRNFKNKKMPLRLKFIEESGVPISFQKPGQIDVRVGPCSAKSWNEEKIPLDGRIYICAGTVILKNGRRLQANFEINTHTFDFLNRDSVKIFIEKEQAWYYFNEPELFKILGVTEVEALPYTWMPDRPLAYSKQGPYPMKN